MPKCPHCGSDCTPSHVVCPSCGLQLPPDIGLLTPGAVLAGRYVIEQFVYEGGMGYIYFAKDKRIADKWVVIKRVKQPVRSDEDLTKLQEEAKRMAQLTHPLVAAILDHFVHDGFYHLVVERVFGKTLKEILEERGSRIPESEVVSWAIWMCDVIQHIHEHGVIHRDVSPDNIMLTEDGIIMFIDFGTLRELQLLLTRGTAGIGKYGYAPPEQWAGRPVPQSDIFALGATIYHLLTGWSPPLSTELMSGHGPQESDFTPVYPSIRTRNPAVSEELEAILCKALELDVGKRYSSAEEMKQDLQAMGKEEVEGTPVLEVDCDELDFENRKVPSQERKSIAIKNKGGGILRGAISASEPWIKVPHAIDPTKHEQEVPVIVDTTGLSLGFAASGTITIRSNGGTQSIKVKLTTQGYEEALSSFQWALGAAAAFGGGAMGFLFSLLGLIPFTAAAMVFGFFYLFWAIVTIARRRWGQLGCGTLIGALVLGIVAGVLAGIHEGETTPAGAAALNTVAGIFLGMGVFLGTGLVLSESVFSHRRRILPAVWVGTALMVGIAILVGVHTSETVFSNPPLVQTAIFAETFEGAFPGSWSVGDSDGDSGEDYWDDSTYRSYAGDKSAWCAGIGVNSAHGGTNMEHHEYDNDMASYMYRQVDLSSCRSATLSYYYWLNSESGYDGLYVAYYDGGEWHYEDKNSGNTDGWRLSSVSIPVTASWVGFYFRSDSSRTYEGAYIDDVQLIAERFQ